MRSFIAALGLGLCLASSPPAAHARPPSPKTKPAAPLPSLAPLPAAARNARYFFSARAVVTGVPKAPWLDVLINRVLREGGKLPQVAVTLPGQKPSVTPPRATAAQLDAAKLKGYMVDGTLKVSYVKPKSMIECNWSGVVATYPQRSIKATTSAGLTVTGAGRIDDPVALEQCMDAIAGVIADEFKRFVDSLK